MIISPLSSFTPWEMEYEEGFGHKPSSKRLIGGTSKEDKQLCLYSKHPEELTLISDQFVDTLQKELCYFLRNNRVMVVSDEAHKIKNVSGGVIATAVMSLAKYGKSRMVLTGTPAPNRYGDLYNMFKFIWPSKNVIGFEVNQLRDITIRSTRKGI